LSGSLLAKSSSNSRRMPTLSLNVRTAVVKMYA
jgi:hypothetical protein